MWHEGERLKEAAIAKTIKAESWQWVAFYESLIDEWFYSLPKCSLFTGEDMRLAVEDALGEPHHPNVWSGCARSALWRWRQAGEIAWRGMELAERPQARTRLCRLYRKVS